MVNLKKISNAILSLCSLLNLVICRYGAVQLDLPGVTTTDRHNILFIITEDLRPEILAYGRSQSITPNINRIADRSVVFSLVTCQVAICAPSRSSLLTGLRPDTLGVYDFSHFGGIRHFRSIPSHFHRSGYQTSVSGKLHHWDSSHFYSHSFWGAPDWESIHRQELKYHNSSVTPDKVNPQEGFFRDSVIVTAALKFMEEMNNNPEPWFLGVGLKGTHMQYQMPHRFWDMYRDHNFSIAPELLKFPTSTPLIHHVRKTEAIRVHYMHSEGTLKSVERDDYQQKGFGRTIAVRSWQELMRGYLACLTYADYQIGKLLDAVERMGLWEKTIVVFTADHGMHLGEKGIWGKWTLFDETSLVPLLIHAPKYPASFGQRYSHPVELIDIFPTLVDLAEAPLETSCPAVTDEVVDDSGGGRGSTSRQAEGSTAPPPLLLREAPVRKQEKRIFRHKYCDDLDGVSLLPVFTYRYRNDSEKEREIGNTPTSARIHHQQQQQQQQQRRTGTSAVPVAEAGSSTPPTTTISLDLFSSSSSSKPKWSSTPREQRESPFRKPFDFSLTQKMTCKLPGRLDNDPFTGDWIDFCPFKKLPRDPPFGAMGYSLRTVDWRYTAWLQFDTNSFLPSLHLPPLAEELYDHRSDGFSLSKLGQCETVNLARDNEYSTEQLQRLRAKLYDFLWFNSSHEHLFFMRLDYHKNRAIVLGRFHPNAHPHHYDARTPDAHTTDARTPEEGGRHTSWHSRYRHRYHHYFSHKSQYPSAVRQRIYPYDGDKLFSSLSGLVNVSMTPTDYLTTANSSNGNGNDNRVYAEFAAATHSGRSGVNYIANRLVVHSSQGADADESGAPAGGVTVRQGITNKKKNKNRVKRVKKRVRDASDVAQ